MQTIQTIYENGVFRPTEHIDLPDRCQVEVEIRNIRAETTAPEAGPMTPGLAKVYEILGRRFRSGVTDTAERHNEHQP